MSSRLPSIQSLAAFEAAARHGNFARAAEELCLTHGAVSHRIRALEELLGASLFSRLHNGAVLTSAGIAMVEPVKKALALITSACAPGAHGTAPARIKLSVLPHFASNWLLSRLPDFRELHPHVDLDLESSTGLADFRDDGTDLAIRYGMGNWPGLASIKLLEDEVFPVCSQDYAAHGQFANSADMARATLLRYAREPWKPWFEEAGLDWNEPAAGPLFSDFGLMLEAAALGHGICLARSTIVENALRSGRLIRLFGHAVQSAFAYYIVYPRDAVLRTEVAALIAWLRNEAAARHSTAAQRAFAHPKAPLPA